MTLLLDANTVIYAMNRRPPIVRERLNRALRAHQVLIPAIAVFELWFGVFKSERIRENAERLRVFLDTTGVILPFEEADGEIAGRFRDDLRRAGTPIGPYDVLIAAQAVRTGSTLVTSNVGEFSRIPGLVIENWLVA